MIMSWHCLSLSDSDSAGRARAPPLALRKCMQH